jgi:hypothetical protein
MGIEWEPKDKIKTRQVKRKKRPRGKGSLETGTLGKVEQKKSRPWADSRSIWGSSAILRDDSTSVTTNYLLISELPALCLVFSGFYMISSTQGSPGPGLGYLELTQLHTLKSEKSLLVRFFLSRCRPSNTSHIRITIAFYPR